MIIFIWILKTNKQFMLILLCNADFTVWIKCAGVDFEIQGVDESHHVLALNGFNIPTVHWFKMAVSKCIYTWHNIIINIMINKKSNYIYM